jgi:hypothetical protein
MTIEPQNYGEPRLVGPDFSTNHQQFRPKTTKRLHLATMFHEYRIQEGKTATMLIHGMYMAFVFLLCALIVFLWMFFGEPLWFRLRPFPPTLAISVLVIAGIFSAFSTVFQAKRFRMLSTDEALEIIRSSRTIRILYSEITRIEILPEKQLLVYTTTSESIPAIIISNNLTDRHILDEVLQRFAIYQPTTRVPLIYTAWYTYLLTGLFICSFTLNFVSADFLMRAASAVVFCITVGITIYIRLKFRSQVSGFNSLILYFLLAGVVILRTAGMFLYALSQ